MSFWVQQKINQLTEFQNSFWPVTYNLFLSNFKARYTKSLLGPAWLILEPALFISITSLVFSHTFDNQVGAIPYYLFVMPGLLIWSFFFSQTQGAPLIFISHRELLTNTSVPKAAIVLAKIMMGGVDYLIRLIILVGLIWANTGAFPLVGLVAALLAGICLMASLFGLSMWLALSNTYYRDFSSIIPILLQVFFYVSPVIYPISAIPHRWLGLIRLNPLTQLIEFLRLAAFSQQFDLVSLRAVVGWTGVILILTWLIFRKFGAKVVEEL